MTAGTAPNDAALIDQAIHPAEIDAQAQRQPIEVHVFSLDRPLIITIDGPAGTGKTTVAEQLARKLGLEMLDTGAMYRVAAALALKHSIRLDQPDRLCDIVRKADIRFDWKSKPPTILAEGQDFSARIRDDDVTKVVSEFAGVRELREIMVEMQRRIAREHPKLVTEGRDQGSVVFPDAKVKFYLTATAQARAMRRKSQLERKSAGTYDLDTLRVEIEKRDTSDRGRPYGALVCPQGAVVVDSTGLDEAQTIDTLHRIVLEQSRA